jgi:cob(I)alamin adenosyltransferase
VSGFATYYKFREHVISGFSLAMKIYTKTGDDGTTGLYGGGRLPKDHPRIEAYGTIDELNAVIGVARAEQLPDDVDSVVARVQNELFALGAELATPKPAVSDAFVITPEHSAVIEADIDRFEARLPQLKQFILPGGAKAAAALHLARTVCRRAERRVLSLAHQPGEIVSPQIVVYLNRLSDLLFVLARAVNQAAGRGDVPWDKGS